MVILVDANVVIDYILNREPSCKSAGKVMKICSQKENSGFRSEERRVGKECL